MRSRHSVLIVDDDHELRRSLRNFLLASGFEALLAPDGVAALKLLDRQPIDAAVIDLRMPRLDGFGVVRALLARPEERRPGVVFVVSAHFELRRRLADLRVCHFFPKPCDALELGGRLVGLLRRLEPGAPPEARRDPSG